MEEDEVTSSSPRSLLRRLFRRLLCMHRTIFKILKEMMEIATAIVAVVAAPIEAGGVIAAIAVAKIAMAQECWLPIYYLLAFACFCVVVFSFQFSGFDSNKNNVKVAT